MSMSATRPYFLRAVYQWILDNHCTPFVAVDATKPAVRVPEEHVKDGQITLNISPSAVQALLMENDCLEFNARFSGVPRNVYIPMSAVLGIYAKENGQGMAFPEEYAYLDDTPPDEPPPAPNAPKKSGKPSLKVVK